MIRHCGVRPDSRQGNDTGNGAPALLQPKFRRSELIGGHFRHENAEGLAGRAVLGRDAEPDIGFNRILGNRPSLGINEAKIVLGHAVALLGFGAEGNNVGVGAGHPQRGGEGEKKNQQRARQGKTGTECFHDEVDKMPGAMLRLFAPVAIEEAARNNGYSAQLRARSTARRQLACRRAALAF